MNVIASSSGRYFNSNDVSKQFCLIGHGNLPSEDALPVTIDSAAVSLATIGRYCVDVGGRAFDSNGKIYCRVDRSCLSPVDGGATSIELPLVYHLDDTPPWHLVDVFLNGLPEEPFKAISMDITFEQDVPNNINLYLCMFGGNTTHEHFYGGFQTNISCPEQLPYQKEVKPDYGVLFSRWGPATLEDCAVGSSDSCFMEAGGYEGNFVSSRAHLKWGAGKYHVRLSRDLIRGEDHHGVWITLDITGPATSIKVGSLRFRYPTSTSSVPQFQLRKQLYQFVEIYGTDSPMVDDMPEFSFIVDNFRFNDDPFQPSKTEAVYYKQCPRYVRVGRCENRSDWHLKYEVGGRAGPSESSTVAISMDASQ